MEGGKLLATGSSGTCVFRPNIPCRGDSDKITKIIGFKPKFGVEDAIRDLCWAFREGKLPNSLDKDIYYNVRTMKKIGAT